MSSTVALVVVDLIALAAMLAFVALKTAIDAGAHRRAHAATPAGMA